MAEAVGVVGALAVFAAVFGWVCWLDYLESRDLRARRRRREAAMWTVKEKKCCPTCAARRKSEGA